MTKKKKEILKISGSQKNLPQGYGDILNSISVKIRAAQARAMSAVSRELIEVYRDIGKTIHVQQESGQ